MKGPRQHFVFYFRSSVHGTLIHISDPVKYSTPYGGRLEWKLPGENLLIAHLKDKQKIRHKKRWSQVSNTLNSNGIQLVRNDDSNQIACNCTKDNRNTAWLRDTVRQTSRGKSAAAAVGPGRWLPAGRPRPLTSRGMSAWPYRVTTRYSFYPVLMNNRSNNNKKKVPHSLPNAVFIQSKTHPGAPISWSSSCKHSDCSQQTYGNNNALHKK